MRQLCLSILALGTLLVGCSRSPSEPDGLGSLALSTVAKATITNRSEPAVRDVIRDQRRWQAAWSDLWGAAAPALPPVDFDREMVIVASAPLCFVDVRIEAVVHDDGVVQVSMAESTPSSLCLCAAPETTFHAVRTRRAFGDARFDVRPIAPTCPS